MLRWAADALAPELAASREDVLLVPAATAPPGSDGLIMLPHLLGERAPDRDGGTSGGYLGLDRTHRRGHLVRAAPEALCQQLGPVLDSIRAGGHEVRAAHATGALIRGEL